LDRGQVRDIEGELVNNNSVVEVIYNIYKRVHILNRPAVLHILESKYVAKDYPNIYEHVFQLSIERNDCIIQKEMNNLPCKKHIKNLLMF